MSGFLLPGDAAPWFTAPSIGGVANFQFDQAGGRVVLLFFAGSTGHEASGRAFAAMLRHRRLFDDRHACLFGVTSDAADRERVRPDLPGIRWFFDEGGAVAKRYHVLVEADGRSRYNPQWVLLDPMLRVVDRAGPGDEERLVAALVALTAGEAPAVAPVLAVPRVFDADFCRRLIDYYEARGGSESGFMRDEGGVTVGAVDHRAKRRADVYVDDEEMMAQVRARLNRFLLPMIERAFQYKVTRVERYLVACYDADGGGYFRAHRDNLTHGTAHRRFACSINLNAEEFEGGDLRFPEFGPRLYRPTTGGAVVFSCTLLHEATPVTRGRRYAYLPFFYDEVAAKQREENQGRLADGLGGYRADAGAPTANAA